MSTPLRERDDDYDDIIIGAGSAGAVIAYRLSEDTSRRVLLLEAGADYPAIEALPAALRNANEPVLSGHNWPIRALVKDDPGAEGAQAVTTTSLHSAFHRPGQTGATLVQARPQLAGAAAYFDYAVGKVTGGSSAVNGALALRGMAEDYEEWSRLCGSDWGWDKVLERFRALETDQDHADSFHGRSGPVSIRRDTKEELAPLQGRFIEACRAQGFSETADHNDPASTGIGLAPRNVVRKIRMSTALTHLDPARSRARFKIIAGAHVHRIFWKNASCCEGVEAEVNGELRRFRGARVILCAGALNTPAILLRSGIGDPSELGRWNITTRLSLSGVGKNLIDHPVVIMWAVPRPGASLLGEPTHQALLRCTSSRATARNDLHLYMLSGIDTGMFPLLKPALRSPVGVGVSAGYMKPKSRGVVRLTSADPKARPQVVANCLGVKEDAEALKEGMRLAWRLLQHPQMHGSIERIHVWSEGMIKSDIAAQQAIATAARPSWHAVGTAKMGKSPTEGAVVDPSGRVFGTVNLWVADASIMPTIPSAPTNLTCMMIGEKIAADLRRMN